MNSTNSLAGHDLDKAHFHPMVYNARAILIPHIVRSWQQLTAARIATGTGRDRLDIRFYRFHRTGEQGCYALAPHFVSYPTKIVRRSRLRRSERTPVSPPTAASAFFADQTADERSAGERLRRRRICASLTNFDNDIGLRYITD